MNKGPSGSTTTTQINPTQQAQTPFLQGGWQQAANLEQNNPLQYYPGQTLADFNPNMTQGYGYLGGFGLGALTANNNALYNGAINAQGNSEQTLNNFLTGQQTADNPATGGLSALAYGGNPADMAAGGLNYLGNANGTAMQQLAATASGAYLNPNPYLAGEYGAAAQPVVNAYQTATAPQTDSNFEAAGRYGSGAQANAQSQNQLNLGTTLGNLAANMYGQDYANERGLQTSAAGTMANAQTGALEGAGNLNIAGTNPELTALSGLQQGWQTGNSQELQSLLMTPSITGLPMTDANAAVTAGQGLTGESQAQIQDAMNRFYGNEQAPYQTLTQYMNNIGQPTNGSYSQSQPYFTNPTQNILGTALGANALFNPTSGMLTGSNGLLSGLFGGSGAGLTPAAVGTPFIMPGTGAALSGTSAAADAGTAAIAAGTVICTELMRQGRMPRSWWLASARDPIPNIARKGYYVWGLPSVRHLRRRPHSLYSRALCRAFNWRAEDIAAKAGVPGARRLLRGRLVTAVLAAPCLILGALCRPRDWRSVYNEKGAPGDELGRAAAAA